MNFFLKILVLFSIARSLIFADITVDTNKHLSALTGTGNQINSYIVNKVNETNSGDTIRLNYFILDYRKSTKYFYIALKNALSRGVNIEIITEAKNTSKKHFCDKTIRKNRYKYSMSFLTGRTMPTFDSTCQQTLDKFEDIDGLENIDGNFTVIKVMEGAQSLWNRAINHRKVALFDFKSKNKKSIIISSANVAGSEEKQYEVAIDIDGIYLDKTWNWWNKVLDRDKCFKSYKNEDEDKLKSCNNILKNINTTNGYFSHGESGLWSYVVDTIDHNTRSNRNSLTNTDEKERYNSILWWLSKMQPSTDCELLMTTGSLSNLDILKKMKNISNTCKVQLNYGKLFDNNSKIRDYLQDNRSPNFIVHHQPSIHAKMILWKGNWGNDGHFDSQDPISTYYSWVGSLNLTTNALFDNDETMVRTNSKVLFDAYYSYFKKLDDKANIFWQEKSNGKNKIWNLNTYSKISKKDTYSYPKSWNYQLAGVADFDADGITDMLWRKTTDGKSYIWYMNDDGSRRTSRNISALNLDYDIIGVK